MAPKKDDTKTTRLTHSNGATVVVPADKAETLIAGGNFAAATKAAAKSSS